MMSESDTVPPGAPPPLERKELKEWRMENPRGIRFTQQSLASTANLSQSEVWAIEKGRTRPYHDTARAIANALGVYTEQIKWPEHITPLSSPSRTARRSAARKHPAPPSNHLGKVNALVM